MQSGQVARRDFLTLLGAGGASLAFPAARLVGAKDAGAKPLTGIFPIAQTPFTDSNKLDVDTLVAQLRFIDRGKVHGFVWPQLASEWSTLSEAERTEGAEAILSAGKNLHPAIVIGVQAPEVETAVRYAKHAAKLGADAIISLPPPKQTDPAVIFEYYKQVGRATELPLFLQAVGNLSVDSIVEMHKAIPTLRYVKDEAGEPLLRIAELRERSSDQLKVFTGSHGKTLIDEMIRGFSGSMPAAPFADIYASAWDLWHAGKRKEAVREFGNAAVLIHEVTAYGMESTKYILCLRGVFKNYRMRQEPSPSGRGGLDEASKKSLREIMELVKPSLHA